jgi:flavorubredoxin
VALDASASVTVIPDSGKNEPTYYTYDRRETAKENISKYLWAKDESKSVIHTADGIVENIDILYNSITGEGVPRGRQIGEKNDPMYNFCRYCGENIVGKYGAQVQALLKKVGGLSINMICPLHGPVLKENIAHYIGLYDTWSSYRPESEGVCIAYASIYGNTKAAAELLASALEARGVKVAISDLARCDIHEAVEDAFRYDRLVLASATYNADVFPPMKEFIHHLTERNYQNRKVAFIENGSWAPMATKIMKGMLEGSKNLTFTETEVRINSAMNQETVEKIKILAEELSKM